MRNVYIGDIFEISTPKGKAYLHYIYKDPQVGRELVRVLPGLYPDRPSNINQLASSKEQYLVFFPLSAASKKKIVEHVGHYSAENYEKPPKMRSAHNVRGEFLGWYIIDTDTWQRELTKALTSDQVRLSDWASWNDTLLIERLANGWSLDHWVSY